MSELGSGAGRQHLLDLLCWKNRQSLVQGGQVTVCECWNWGFGEKKLAARPIFKWEIWQKYSNYQWFGQNNIGGRLQTIEKHAQNAGKRRSVIIDETPKNVVSRVQLSTRRDVLQLQVDL